VDKPYYAITFNDNTVWSTIEELRSPTKNDEEMIKFISEKTNIEIAELEIDANSK